MEGFGYVRTQEVEFRDLDGLGHVNNAVYLTLSVGLRVSRVGAKSLEFEFETRGPDGRLVAEGSSVHVAFDYGARRPVTVSEGRRRVIEAHEAKELAAT